MDVVPLFVDGSSLKPGMSDDNLGCGFKLNISDNESPFRGKLFQSGTGKTAKRRGSSTYTSCEVINSPAGVKSQTNIADPLGISYGPMVSGEVAWKYVRNFVATPRQVCLWYRSMRVHSSTYLLLDMLVPNEDAADSIRGGHLDVEKYGTLFLSQILWGAQLDITFILTSAEDEDLTKLAASLKARLGAGAQSGGCTGDFSPEPGSSSGNRQLSIKLSANGVAIDVPASPSLKQVEAIIAEFNTEYDALCQEEDAQWDTSAQHVRLSPVGFTLTNTSSASVNPCLKTLHTFEESALQEKMAMVAEAFVTASFWRESLKVARKECEREYSRPTEQDRVARAHTLAVIAEVEKLRLKQEECLAFRGRNLTEILGGPGAEPAVAVPAVYPGDSSNELKHIRGLCGKGTLQAPVTLEEGSPPLDYDYEGFLVLLNDKLWPTLWGRLVQKLGLADAGRVVAEARLPGMLADLARISNHVINPARLCTRFMVDETFTPACGELLVPDDMRQVLDSKDSNGRQLLPSFKGKKMVLMGPQGSGKTSLFNRLTGSRTRAAAATESITTEAVTRFARGPAQDLLIVDTPGTANNTQKGMSVKEALALRQALVSGIVAQVVVVVSPNATSRAAALVDLFAGALNSIFECNTFKRDGSGQDLSMQSAAAERSPRRPRAFVVVTMRDKVEDERRYFETWAQAAREAFPWIGPVAFVDERVSLAWLYDTVVACAGYSFDCCTNHMIPLVEMFAKFTMTFVRLKSDWEEHITQAKRQLSEAMDCALDEIDAAVADRIAHGRAGGSYEDTVASKIDCIIHFVDDHFETTSQQVLAACYNTSLDDLWATTDEHELNDRVHTLNSIKGRLAGKVNDVRKRIRDCYPDSGEAAVYKRCPNPECRAVYTRPTGCNELGKCGWKAGANRDAGHNGRMNVRFIADYEPAEPQTHRAAKLTIQERNGNTLGPMETLALGLRRGVRQMATNLPIHGQSFYRDDDADEQPPNESARFGDYGCGTELRWDDMIALTRAELDSAGLVPGSDAEADLHLEPVQDLATMPVETFLRTHCGAQYLEYLPIFTECDLKSVEHAIKAGKEDLRSVLEDSGVPKMKVRVILAKLAELTSTGW